MRFAPADAHAAVFDHFGVAPADRPTASCYRWAPVYRTRVDGRIAAIKRTAAPLTDADGLAAWLGALADRGIPVVSPLALPVRNPAPIGRSDEVWVAYPWIDGRRYDGSDADVAAAGDLLGRLHTVDVPDDGVPDLTWPAPDADSVAEDIDGLRPVVPPRDLHRLSAQLAAFTAETLPAIRDAGLPTRAVSLDFKAENLVYTVDGPVLVDPDNADRAPRLLDLANAALLFHNDRPEADALFDPGRWAVFRDAYTRRVALTADERALWPVAVRYMILEWAVWTLIDAGRHGEWNVEPRRSFLCDLAGTDEHRFPL
ncbi:hypothetical protein Val02_77430 [Virgisporangium aliadipatigenens]|uniref:Aminoglycoside phosphotransferase domain-containing protein n=1 Tax=Virgisporangium aliadipatigenens TaxID=741659 RepID=A0A8J3YUQ4_9ACTN|nr:phosphotransferase [Virgisporangium aliadipatigenens]GIJ50857.1 hypothetical protein Val02_77430 [Virgisporangium aliadipatigenens]